MNLCVSNSPKTENFKKSVKDTGAALGASIIVPSIAQTGSAILACESMGRLSTSLSKDQIDIVNKGVDKIINEATNLGTKGVKVVDARTFDPAGFKTLKETGTSTVSKLKKYLLNFMDPMLSLKNGKNACFAPPNKVIYNPQKMSLAAFHELGHAHNHHNSKVWKFIQTKCRKPALIIPFVMAALVSFTKNSKPEEGKELNFFQKTKNFIRNNAACIAAVSTLPMVAEEIVASVKGCKWANKLLDKNLARKVFATNALGAVTYLAIGTCFALGINWAKNIKDS